MGDARLVGGGSSALSARSAVLDELLPLLRPRRVELHHHVSLLEVSDAATLLELAANPRIRRYLLARLSDTVALVDPGQADVLARALLAEGHTPKFVTGAKE